MSAPCGCTAVWGWSPARKSFWSAGGITYDASLEFGTCAHRNVLQRPDTNFRMQGRRGGDVLTTHHCTECGSGEGALHRGGEKCPGLQRMRQSHGLKPIEAGYSCLDAVRETRLRPYKSELAVMMVDDMSEPP